MPNKPVSEMPEVAFYYPNPIWSDGDWIKSLILFFDGIALLVPSYMKERIEQFDPAIVVGLKQHNLLQILEPEQLIDKPTSHSLASALTDIIVSGALDVLAKDSNSSFQEISMSRLGFGGDEGVARMIFEELKTRGLVQDSKDSVSVPMHPLVRSLVLTLLSQILRSHGRDKMQLNPVTDRPKLVQALVEMLDLPNAPSSGNVVSFDLASVGVDLSSVPIDEVLSFRKENAEAHRTYRRAVRTFAYEISRMSGEERSLAFEARQAELDDLASDLRGISRKAWKKPASFALTLAGAAWTLATGDPIGAILAAGGAFTGVERPEVGAFSYLFRAHERFLY